MLDFVKLRKEYNPYTIDDFEVTTGEIYSSDQDSFHEKWKKDFVGVLPKYLNASDDVVVDDQKRVTKAGLEYSHTLLKSTQAVRRRYIRTNRNCKYYDGMKITNFIIIDHDKPFGHEDWIGKLPTPQYVVINPVSAKCHLIYLLDQSYDPSIDIYQSMSNYMAKQLGADRANPVSFRSPFFVTGNRKRHEYFRKGKREADYHYVIYHDQEPYSLGKLYKALPDEAIENDLDKLHTYYITDIGIGSSASEQEKWIESGRNSQLFHRVSEIAGSKGASITFEEVMEIANEYNIGHLAHAEVSSVARSVFNFMQKKFRGVKKTDQEREEQARLAANARWYAHNQIVGETLAEAADRFGVSYPTIKRWKVKGRIVLIKKQWVEQDELEASQEPWERELNDFTLPTMKAVLSLPC